MESSQQDQKELERAIEEARAEILVAGCGGAGGNAVSRITGAGPTGVETLAVNTDAQDLLHVSADQKVLIGREITGGRGAGNDPELGEEAALDSRDLLEESLYGKDMVFVTCGLGGGTGTGASPVVAEIANGFGALTVGVVTLPMEVEGRRRSKNASWGLKKLRGMLDTIIIIPDDNIFKVDPDLSIGEAFEVADGVLMNIITGISELVTEPGLINLDFADIRTTLQDGGIAQVGMGESNGEDRARIATEEALESPLLDTDLLSAEEAIVSIKGDRKMTLEEAEAIVDRISASIGLGARINWGAYISDGMVNSIRVLAIVPGANSPWEDGLELEKKEAERRIDHGLGSL